MSHAPDRGKLKYISSIWSTIYNMTGLHTPSIEILLFMFSRAEIGEKDVGEVKTFLF